MEHGAAVPGKQPYALRGVWGWGLTLGITAIALLISGLFYRWLGHAGIYLPPLAAVLIAAAYAGTWPALLSQGTAIAAILSLAANSLYGAIRVVDIYSAVAFLIIGNLGLFLIANVRSNFQLRRSKEHFEMIARATHDTIWQWNLKNDQVWRTGNLKGIFGIAESEFVSDIAWWRDRLHPDDSQRVWSSIWQVIEGRGSRWAEEYKLRQQSGVYIQVADHGFVVRDSSGGPTLMVGGMADISARRRAEEQLLHQASHDSLTGLPNRETFLARLEQAVSKPQAGDAGDLAVLVIDIDRFKIVNESLGHEVGDELLANVAARLMECLRREDIAARFAGDEFAVLLNGIGSIADAQHIADRIQDTVSRPLTIRGHGIVITVSIGIALVDPEKPEAVLRHADVAMYRAKSGGKARSEVFEPSLDTRAMSQLQLETDLRHGIREGQFQVYYQPIVSLKTGKLVSFEALLRWSHPERGVLLPGEFLSIADEAGLASQLGQLVLRQACRQFRDWRNRGLAEDVKLNINLSGKEFSDPLVVDRFRNALAEAQLRGEAVTLELTESIIMEDRALALEKLSLFRELGMRLAVDDFGTGHSSLARLQDFPISILKVDASFVSGISEGRPEILDAIVALAQELKLDVTAEGVETADQLNYLRRSGAGFGQGRFLSDALPVKGAEALLLGEVPWHTAFEQPVQPKPRTKVAASVSS